MKLLNTFSSPTPERKYCKRQNEFKLLPLLRPGSRVALSNRNIIEAHIILNFLRAMFKKVKENR